MLIVGIYKLRYSSLLKLERSQAKSRQIAIFGLSSRKAPKQGTRGDVPAVFKTVEGLVGSNSATKCVFWSG